MKLCKRCKQEKPATPEFFYRNCQSPDGLHAYCKMCKSDIHKVYARIPLVYERIKESMKNMRKRLKERR
jgi:hypothetical protein